MVFYMQKDGPLGSIDLFECTGIDRSNGKKGFGFDIKVHVHILLVNHSLSTCSLLHVPVESRKLSNPFPSP